MKKVFLITLILALIGLMDASYLTYQHYTTELIPCHIGFSFADCGKVLNSTYATLFGIPVALLGIVYYSILIIIIGSCLLLRRNRVPRLLVFVCISGFAMTLYFVFLQLFIIKAICLYCMVSAIACISIFLIISSIKTIQHYGK